MEWLRSSTIFESNENIDDNIPSTSGNRGRPTKSLDECSAYTRKRKLEEVTEAISQEHLSGALSVKYTKVQERSKSEITKAVLKASPARVQRIK